VPLYSCPVVFDAIIKAGFVPEFIDIDLENYTIDPLDLTKKIGELKAVIVIHTFGRPADMDIIKNIAGEIPIIEDCAHSLFSFYKGKMTGTLGNASFFSFKKYPSAGEGGMIILNDIKLIDRLEKIVRQLPEVSKINNVKHAFVTYAHSFLYHRPWYGTIAFPIGNRILNKKEIILDFNVSIVRGGDLKIFMRKIGSLGKKIEIQTNYSRILIEELWNTSIILPDEVEGTRCNYYLFPIRFQNEQLRDCMHINLRKFGIDSAKLYAETPQLSKRIYRYNGTCSNAETLSKTVLVIPNYYTLKEIEIMKIANILKMLDINR